MVSPHQRPPESLLERGLCIGDPPCNTEGVLAGVHVLELTRFELDVSTTG